MKCIDIPTTLLNNDHQMGKTIKTNKSAQTFHLWTTQESIKNMKMESECV
jgi:hypothetical protein